jgi:hypothetical protein
MEQTAIRLINRMMGVEMPRGYSFEEYVTAINREAAASMARSIDADILRLYNEPCQDNNYSISVDAANATPYFTTEIPHLTRPAPRTRIEYVPPPEPIFRPWPSIPAQVSICGKCGGTGSIRMNQRNDWSKLRGTLMALSPNRRHPCDVCNRDNNRSPF